MAKQVGAARWLSWAPLFLWQLQLVVLLMGAKMLCLELCSSLVESGALTKSLTCSHSAPQAGKTMLTQNGFVAFTLFCPSICFLRERQAQALERDQINKRASGAKALGIFVLH